MLCQIENRKKGSETLALPYRVECLTDDFNSEVNGKILKQLWCFSIWEGVLNLKVIHR